MTDRTLPPPSAGRRPSFDPELVGHDPAFAPLHVRGEPVGSEQLTAEALRRRFTSPPRWQPEIVADARLAQARQPLREAAVLIPLVMHESGPTVLLTRRTAQPARPWRADQLFRRRHQSITTKPRWWPPLASKTEEEVGLRSESVEGAGSLPRYATATGLRGHTGWWLWSRRVSCSRLTTFEVEEVFEPPLAFLMNPRITSAADRLRWGRAARLRDALRGRAALFHLARLAANAAQSVSPAAGVRCFA